MTDDALLDRLQRAAADVPPSTLDLGAVLRSARRKRVRHRAAVASGCVAAVAGVGAVAPAVSGVLPPDRVPDVAAALLTDDSCTDTPLLIPESATGADPVVVYAEAVRVLGDGTPPRTTVLLDAGGPDVTVPDAPAVVRDEILRSVREPGADSGQEQAMPGRPGAWSSSRDVGSLGPGSYVVYDEGAMERTIGLAQCGTTVWPYTVTSWSGGSRYLLDCAAPGADSLRWAVKELGCPTAADDDYEWDRDSLRRYLTKSG